MTKEELVKRYRKVYKKKTGMDLPEDDALDQAMKLVSLVEVIYPKDLLGKGIKKGKRKF